MSDTTPFERLDLGGGFSVGFLERGDFVSEARFWQCYDEGIPCSFMLHRGEQFVGRAPVRGPGPLWTVVSRSPLTLTPSLACQPAGIHGFITAGKWIPC